jgi:hypothetical protein
VEIGAGFDSVTQRGTTHGDSITPTGFVTNNAGGILGGISSGQDLEVSIAIKPTSSIISPRQSIDIHNNPVEVVTKGRHDPCVGIRATPIAEAMLALVVMEHVLRNRAQCGDVQTDAPRRGRSRVPAGVFPLVPPRHQWPPERGHLLAFAGLSASYFAHIGFFNPYLPLWLKDLGLPIFTISLLASVQSVTRVFAPYAWGALSDHTGHRVMLLRFSAAVALASSFGLWWHGGAWWLALVLLVMFTHTSSMMSLTEAAMAQLVAGDWGATGAYACAARPAFLVTVFVAGEWFERFGMKHFPAWAAGTLAIVLIATMKLPDVREPVAAHDAVKPNPSARCCATRWCAGSSPRCSSR